ncbi:MAG TPA: hypothetical protein PK093_20810, partial [Phycisphaerae bacterium]|nr:hypothetical protein [Phycisphaerae bacterium]
MRAKKVLETKARRNLIAEIRKILDILTDAEIQNLHTDLCGPKRSVARRQSIPRRAGTNSGTSRTS